MFDLLFSDITIATLDVAQPVLNHAYLGVKDGKITYVGTDKPQEAATETIDGKGKLIMPGLVNSHTHMPMAAFKGWGDGHDLHTWLEKYIFPYEDKLDSKAATICCQLGLAEAIASGTTTYQDMYFFYDQVAPAVAASGINANLARGCVTFDPNYVFDGSLHMQETKQLVDDWHGHDNYRMMVDASIHGEYTSNGRLWTAITEYAQQHKLGMHLHLSETKAEHEGCLARHNGQTPAQVFAAHGVFNVRTVAAHCVWIAPEDRDILAKHGVTAVHNPVSNLKLASGVADVPAMLQAGVNVALGTDGVSSNDSLDMFEEIKLAAILHKGISYNPTILSTLDALHMGTRNGAVALGRGNDTGRLAVGFWADIIMLDMDKPHFYPCHDVLALLTYAARGADVCRTIVRGKTLYQDGQHLTIDVEKAKAELISYVLPKVFQ